MEDGQEAADCYGGIGALSQVYWKNQRDPVTNRALQSLCPALKEVLSHAVLAVLNEMQVAMADPEVQSTGVRLLRTLFTNNALVKEIVLKQGGLSTFSLSMQRHPTVEYLLLDMLSAVDELQGLESLLKIMLELRQNAPAALAALRAFKRTADSRWKEVQKLPPRDLLQAILSVALAHPQDERILEISIHLVGDVCGEEAQNRTHFAAANGWQWVLDVLERHPGNVQVQLNGVKLVAQLCKGGSWGEAYAQRAAQLIGDSIYRHCREETFLYWGIWAIQQLGGASAILIPLRRGALGDIATVAALRSLSCLNWGQSDDAGPELVQPVVETVISTMQSNCGQQDVLFEGASALGNAAEFACCCAGLSTGENTQRACWDALHALLELLTAQLTSEKLASRILECLVAIMDKLQADSTIRHQLTDALWKSGDCGLLSKLAAQHPYNGFLHSKIMWMNGVTHGIASVVQEMDRNPACHSIQMCGIRALSALYHDNLELSAADNAARRGALNAAATAMEKFPENLVLQQHCCFLLSAIAEHGADEFITTEQLVVCLNAASQALQLVKGRCDAQNDPGSYNALYLRKEATRLVGCVCCAMPSLGRQLSEQQGPRTILEDALIATACGVADAKRDSEAEDVLQLELVALACVIGPVAIVESLRKWGTKKPAVVKAAACTVVHLTRRHQSEVSELQRELQSKGCSAEFLAAMESYSADVDLQGHVHLALGFIGGPQYPQQVNGQPTNFNL